MHCQFFRDTDGIVDRTKSWLWLQNGDLKKGTEALFMAAQEQAIRTNYVKHHIDKSRDSPTQGWIQTFATFAQANVRFYH